jgi:L-ascorbate metabolism protein UlaG (beta-lactamase superfamily)
MRVRWYGQAAFLLTGKDQWVFIDPFGDVSGLTARGSRRSRPTCFW